MTSQHTRKKKSNMEEISTLLHIAQKFMNIFFSHDLFTPELINHCSCNYLIRSCLCLLTCFPHFHSFSFLITRHPTSSFVKLFDLFALVVAVVDVESFVGAYAILNDHLFALIDVQSIHNCLISTTWLLEFT